MARIPVIDARDLVHEITFQARDQSTDSFGQQNNAWADAFTDRARIRTLTGKELLAAQAINSDTTHEITVRYRPELEVPKDVIAMRILFRDRAFNIQTALNIDERNVMVNIQASEGLNDG